MFFECLFASILASGSSHRRIFKVEHHDSSQILHSSMPHYSQSCLPYVLLCAVVAYFACCYLIFTIQMHAIHTIRTHYGSESPLHMHGVTVKPRISFATQQRPYGDTGAPASVGGGGGRLSTLSATKYAQSYAMCCMDRSLRAYVHGRCGSSCCVSAKKQQNKEIKRKFNRFVLSAKQRAHYRRIQDEPLIADQSEAATL